VRKTLFFVFLIISIPGFTQSNKNIIAKDPAVIITMDIDHFWDAYDHLEKCYSFEDSVHCIESLYFDKGTGGFKDFISKYNYAPQDFVKSLGQYPRFFKSIRNNTLEVKNIETGINRFYVKLKENFPGYKPLKICFVISPLQSGGTALEHYLVIGTEIVASTKEADLSEFGTSVLGKVLAFDTNIRDNLIFVIAHETIHDLQVNADFNNYELLNKSLNEGSADFLAELFTGVRANHYLYDFGDLHEHDLWNKFTRALDNHENTDNWMYNIDRVEEGVPADLGYYVGYRIAESYYRNATDKKQAILEIIQMKNPEEFLEKSRYGK
jgi:hypothetical protein